MVDVLRGLLIAGAVGLGVCLAAALWLRHQIRRQLRISPARRTPAPTVWVASPSAASRLHRRLRSVATSARLASAMDPALTSVAEELVGEAIALEPHVLAVAGTRRAGSSVRQDLSVRISELEAVARRLTALSNRSTTHPEASSATRLRERLVALEAAREELAEIDLRAGVLRHT